MHNSGRGQKGDKAAGREDHIPQNSGDCDIHFDSGDFFGVGHSDPPLKAEDAKRSLLNGFIHLDYLIGFLAEDEGLDAALPALWDFFDCHKMSGPSQNEDSPDPLLAWRKLAYVWAGFVEPATGAVLPPFQRLQAYDYEPAQRKFIPAEGRAYPDFVQYLKVGDIERLFRQLSILLEIDLRLPGALVVDSSPRGRVATQATASMGVEGADLVPTISFFRDGEYWKIGFVGREKSFKHRRGFSYLVILLQNPGKEIACQDLYHGSDELLHHAEGDMSKRISQEDRKVAGYDGRSPDREEVIFPERRAAFHNEIERLLEEKAKPKTNLSLDPEEMISQLQEIDRKIRQIKNYMNQRGTTATAQDNNARTNIQRNIRTAVDAILLEIPELKPYLNMELPGRTVNTGIRCSYLPGPYGRARWNLDPPRVG